MNQIQRLKGIRPWHVWDSGRLAAEKEGSPRTFARGFQMQAFTDEERMFQSFQSCCTPGVAASIFSQRGWPTFIGVDLAGAKRPGNVIFIAAVDPNTQRRYPLEILTGGWTSPETARQLAMASYRHPNTRVIMVENNGYQQAIVDWVRNSPVDHSFWYKVEAFTTGANKMKTEIGLPSLEVEFKNRAWVIPSDEFEGHPLVCRCGWCTWKLEMRDFPMSATTDTVMAMWFCREAISRWGAAPTSQQSGNLSDVNTR